MSDICYVLKQIDLTNFRNYERLRFEPNEGMNILFGANGAGKTNLIEAISLLIPGRGLRTAPKEALMRHHNQDFALKWGVAAHIDDREQQIKIATGAQESERRVVFINGEKSRQSDLSRFFNSIWLTPSQDRLFMDGSGARRRFLDRLVFGMDPAHAGRLVVYEKSMRERAKLLAQNISDPDWLEAIENKMVRSAIAVTAARHDIIGRLGKYTLERQGLFPQAQIHIKGDIDEWLLSLSAIEVEDKYSEVLCQYRSKDAKTGMTHMGPHRSDMVVTHFDKQLPASLCSTGEQKALLISLILANGRMQGAERGIKPVLLLDEITAHLDPLRRRSLFDELKALKIQAFMTGTESSLFDDIPQGASFWNISEGQIKALS